MYTHSSSLFNLCWRLFNQNDIFDVFPIHTLLKNSMIIAYLKTRQTASFYIINNTKSKFTIDSAQPR